jgi:hypothetical protein
MFDFLSWIRGIRKGKLRYAGCSDHALSLNGLPFKSTVSLALHIRLQNLRIAASQNRRADWRLQQVMYCF